MLIFRYINLFWVTTRIALHAVMLKIQLQLCIPPLSETLCLFKAPPSQIPSLL